MILYTPLSELDIFPHAETDFANRHCVSYEGKSFYVEQRADGSYELLQLLSTNPTDFMENKYMPGTIINNSNFASIK